MASAIQKIALNASRDIPFNKLVLSQSNVRRVKAGLSIEELAHDIERRGLLQSLNVRPVLNGEGAETGTSPASRFFETPDKHVRHVRRCHDEERPEERRETTGAWWTDVTPPQEGGRASSAAR